MIGGGGINKSTYERTYDTRSQKISRLFVYTETFTITKTTTRCTLIVTNQPNYMELLRLTSLKIQIIKEITKEQKNK